MMKFEKRYVPRIFLAVEMMIFAGFYIFGSNGVKAMGALCREITNVDAHIIHLKEEIQQTRSMIALQKEHPFFQEKIAREQLQMAAPNDEIYVL